MLVIAIVVSVVGLDQWTKYLTDLYLTPLGSSIPIWENVLHLTSVHNRGAAFGVLAGARWFFLVITVLACTAILIILIKHRNRIHTLLEVCLALVMAGAIGNMIDRAALGYVRDMIDFRLINFAVFNIADCAVTVGALILILDLLFGKSKKLLEESDAQKPGKHADKATAPKQLKSKEPKQGDHHAKAEGNGGA